jgi:hypothetical protein
MPQGARNAAVYWASVVARVFEELIRDWDFLNYQDDLLVYASSLEGHLDTLEKMYNTLRDNHMNLKISKTHLNYHTMRVLGHIMSQHGRMVDPKLVEAITKLQPPTTLQGIQSLIGLAHVAREYVPALATLLEPIQALSRKYSIVGS